jgi:perosamine synthetase
VKALEAESARHTGAKHWLTACRGTVALHMALAAVGVGPADVVIASR